MSKKTGMPLDEKCSPSLTKKVFLFAVSSGYFINLLFFLGVPLGMCERNLPDGHRAFAVAE